MSTLTPKGQRPAYDSMEGKSELLELHSGTLAITDEQTNIARISVWFKDAHYIELIIIEWIV